MVDCFNCVNDAYVLGEVARVVQEADGVSVPGDDASTAVVYGRASAALFG